MENQQRQQVKKYFDLLTAHWKLLVVCLLIGLTVGLAVYLYMPKLYRCTALLSYERQQINPSRMNPEKDNQRIRDTVSTMRNVVLSRGNLVQIITDFDLYTATRKKLPIEDVVDIMRKHIKIAPASRGDSFTVAFDGKDQQKVMQVTNALAVKFIDENLKYREERATETSRYTQNELNLAKTVLDKKEQVMRDYKLKYYNEMPEQRESNLARLNALHEQHQAVQDSIQDLERTKVMVQEQINLRKQLVGSMGSAAVQTSAPRAGQTVTPWQRLQQLRSHLAALQVKYTDKHPEVRHTKQQIARLEADLDGTRPPSGTQRTTRRRAVQDPEIGQLKIQLKEISLNIKKLRADQETIRAEIPKYEQWIAAAPVREAEWKALTRDYDELRRNYDYLVAQNLQASSVEHLERKQKGSKFKIVDLARFPDKPYKPIFLQILLIAAGGGLAVGACLVFGMDFIDTSFTDVSDVESYLGLPVVCSIPYLAGKGESGKQRMHTVLWIGGFLLYFGGLLAAFVLFWQQGRVIL